MSLDTINLGDFAYLVKDTFLPSENSEEFYVGLEHIEPNSLRISNCGIASNAISQKFIFRKGDILFGKLRPYFRKVAVARFDGVCSTDFWVVRAKKGFDQKFLFYVMASQDFVDFVNQASEGTRMPRAKWSYAENYKINEFSLSEQTTIGKILSSLDNKIELNRKMNATLEAMAKALFKAWFVDFEPVRANMENRPSESASPEITKLFPSEFENDIPNGWEEKGLDEIAHFLNGLALQKFPPESENEFLPVIKIAQLRKGNTEGSDKASKNLNPAYIVKDGDVLFSWSGSLEVEIWCGGNGALNQHLFKVTSKDFPKWFYFLWTRFHLPEFREIAAHKATTMGHIQRYHLTNAKVIVPDSILLKTLNKVFEPLISKWTENLIEAKQLAEIRDSLLPRLISGKLPVSLIENEIKGATE